jgi:anti-sigma factor RsiW
MTCKELTDFLGDYRSGELPAETLVAFEEHLAECPDCVAYVESYEATIALGKAAFGEGPIPGDVPEGLVRAILAARGKRR